MIACLRPLSALCLAGLLAACAGSPSSSLGELPRTPQASIDQLCAQIGEDADVLVRYFDYVKALGFEAEPNYDYLRKMLREVLVRRKEENAPYDWEKYSSQERKRP